MLHIKIRQHGESDREMGCDAQSMGRLGSDPVSNNQKRWVDDLLEKGTTNDMNAKVDWMEEISGEYRVCVEAACRNERNQKEK